MAPPEGILLVDKPMGLSSFSVVARVRRRTGQPRVGHAGTLDPSATGLLVLLLGRPWTRKAADFLRHDKEYEATLRLGVSTDSYDREGKVLMTSDIIPSRESVVSCIETFRGSYLQTPPMFSAKKIGGKRLYELARRGISVDRVPVSVDVWTSVLAYDYPYVSIHVRCSKGTYVRSLAYDIGERLGCHAHVTDLRRTRSGPFRLADAIALDGDHDLVQHMRVEVGS